MKAQAKNITALPSALLGEEHISQELMWPLESAASRKLVLSSSALCAPPA